MKTKGWPVATILRGTVVMRDFAATGTARGAPLRFVDTLEPA
jgi:dihydroorotase